MTMPASLPITTDYFPDKRSLQIDYVLSDYSIEPEVVNAELGERYGEYLILDFDSSSDYSMIYNLVSPELYFISCVDSDIMTT